MNNNLRIENNTSNIINYCTFIGKHTLKQLNIIAAHLLQSNERKSRNCSSLTIQKLSSLKISLIKESGLYQQTIIKSECNELT